MFEHSFYLPLMFACLIIAAPAYRRKKLDWLRAGLFCAIIAVFSFWTYERNCVWIDNVTLRKDCVQKSKGKARPHYNLGFVVAEQGRFKEAIGHYSEAVRIKPDYVKALNNLGFALAKQGSFRQAITHYSRALQIEPDYARAHNNLGIALVAEGRLEEAIHHFSRTLEIEPDHRMARIFLKLSLQQLRSKRQTLP